MKFLLILVLWAGGPEVPMGEFDSYAECTTMGEQLQGKSEARFWCVSKGLKLQ